MAGQQQLVQQFKLCLDVMEQAAGGDTVTVVDLGKETRKQAVGKEQKHKQIMDDVWATVVDLVKTRTKEEGDDESKLKTRKAELADKKAELNKESEVRKALEQKYKSGQMSLHVTNKQVEEKHKELQGCREERETVERECEHLVDEIGQQELDVEARSQSLRKLLQDRNMSQEVISACEEGDFTKVKLLISAEAEKQ